MACTDVAPHSGDWVRSARPAYGWHGGRSRPALRGSDLDATFWDAVGLNGLRDAPRSQHAYGVCDLQQPARPHYAWQPHGCTLHQLDGSTASCATLGRTLLVVGGLPDLGLVPQTSRLTRKKLFTRSGQTPLRRSSTCRSSCCSTPPWAATPPTA